MSKIDTGNVVIEEKSDKLGATLILSSSHYYIQKQSRLMAPYESELEALMVWKIHKVRHNKKSIAVISDIEIASSQKKVDRAK